MSNNFEYARTIAKILGMVVGVGLAVVFWDSLLRWIHNSLTPSIRKSQFSFLAPYLENAYMSLDDLAESAKYKVAKAWGHVRQNMLLQEITFEKNGSVYSRTVESYFTDDFTSEDPEYTMITSKTEINPNNIPDDLKQDISRGEKPVWDITEKREQEFLEMGYSN